jgi:hypothetical protein
MYDGDSTIFASKMETNGKQHSKHQLGYLNPW